MSGDEHNKYFIDNLIFVHRLTVVFVPCSQEHIQQIIKLLQTFFSLVNNISDDFPGARGLSYITIHLSRNFEPPIFMWLSNFFDYKFLRFAYKRTQLTSMLFRNCYIKQ